MSSPPPDPRPAPAPGPADDVFVSVDLDGRITYAGASAAALAGEPADALAGRALFEAIPLLAGDSGRDALRRAIGARAEAGFEARDPATGRRLAARAWPVPGGAAVHARAVDEEAGAGGVRESDREIEARFRALADDAPVMIWMSDTHNRGTYFNRPWLDFTGRTLEEELGAGWAASIHPDDLERVVAFCQGRFEERREFRMEFRMRRADGAWRWVLDHGVPRRDASGAFVGYVGSCVDVTDFKRVESARESERERLRRVLSQLPAAVAVYEGPEHVFVAMSERYHRVVGRREVMGRPLAEAIPELVGQGFVRLLDEVYASGRPYVGIGVRADWDEDGDGRIEEHLVDVVYQPLTDAGGAVYGVVAHLTDVTERERTRREIVEARAEAEARAAEAARLAAELRAKADELQVQVEESRGLAAELRGANEELVLATWRAETARERVAVLAEASSRLAASLDTRETVRAVAHLAVPALADWCFVEAREEDGPIRLVAAGNRDPEKVEWAFEVMRRYPIDPDAPYGTARVMRTGEAEVMLDIPPEVFEGVAQDEEHLRILREVGFRSSISVPMVAGGRTFGVLSLVYGESGRRYTPDDVPLARELAHRAATALENARLYEEALAANRAKASFLATMSHELRTPLNAMIGYVDLLLLGIPVEVPAAARSHVERIRLASLHLLSIIEEILAFSRLEAGRETVDAEEVDLGALASEVSAIIEPLAAARGLAFHVPARPDPPTLRTDPRKLRQILVNLLGNAVKFTREGGVWFEVERGPGEVRLRVRDTGIGVDPRFHELIFEPFRQVDGAPTRAVGGTGLGLAVSRRLARLLGGDVTVESEPGRGSTFSVSLPDESA